MSMAGSAPTPMKSRDSYEQRAVPLELFFDLVFALTTRRR